MYWPSIAWAIWVLFVDVQHWWALWGAHNLLHWTLGGFVLQLLVPVELFLLSSLVLPPRDEGGTIDLGAWFARRTGPGSTWCFSPSRPPAWRRSSSALARSSRRRTWGSRCGSARPPVSACGFKSPRAQKWLTAQGMVMTVVYSVLALLAAAELKRSLHTLYMDV